MRMVYLFYTEGGNNGEQLERERKIQTEEEKEKSTKESDELDCVHIWGTCTNEGRNREREREIDWLFIMPWQAFGKGTKLLKIQLKYVQCYMHSGKKWS